MTNGFKHSIGEKVSHVLAEWNPVFRCMVVVALRLELTEAGIESRQCCVRILNGGTLWFSEGELAPPWDPTTDQMKLDS